MRDNPTDNPTDLIPKPAPTRKTGLSPKQQKLLAMREKLAQAKTPPRSLRHRLQRQELLHPQDRLPAQSHLNPAVNGHKGNNFARKIGSTQGHAASNPAEASANYLRPRDTGTTPPKRNR